MLEKLKFAYHVGNNLRVSVRNSLLGEGYAELRRLQRAGRVIYGPGTYGFPKLMTFIKDDTRLIVGSYSSLNGTFVLGGEHAVDRVTTYPHRIYMRMEGAGEDGFPQRRGDILLGSDVWTGAGALILGGVNIGDGAIVGAGAVVTKDVPPFGIVVGNPASLIRYRFDEAQIEALLDIRWWDWPEDKVREAVPLLASVDVGAFIAYARGGAVIPNGAGSG